MNSFLANASFFGALLCLVCYFLGRALARRFPHPLMNPLLIAIVLCIAFLAVFRIDYDAWNVSASKLTWLLTPSTVALAIPLYEKIDLLRRHAGAVLLSILAGSLTSGVTVLALRLLCGLDASEYVTLLPKSVTTAIGMPLAEQLGGMGAVAAIAIILTGLAGNVMAPALLKFVKVEDPIARGLAIGTAAHAVGTARAIELGEIEGAMSGLAIAVAGLMTAVIAPLFAAL